MKFFLFFVLATSVLVQAEILDSPDNNTLWLENGKSFAPVNNIGKRYYNGGIWYAKNIAGQIDEKGIVITPTGRQGELKTCIPINKDFPWLVIELDDIVLSQSYNNISLGHFTGALETLSVIREVVPSILLIRLANAGSKQARQSITNYFYGAQATVCNMKVVRKPDALPEIIQVKATKPGEVNAGDKITFRVTTKRKVKDVSLAFMDAKSQPVKLNGLTELQLLPPGDDDCIWEATVDIQSIDLPEKKSNWMAKARILGGGFRKPVIFNVGLKKGNE